MRYDLILKQGLVIDPKNGRHGVMDVAVHAGRVAAVQDCVADEDAVEVLDMKGRIVTPGLIDAHLHVFVNSCDMGAYTDRYCMPSGVTTACDAGSTGALNFPGLRELLGRAVRTRCRAFLNLSLIGITGVEVVGELAERRYADPEACVRTIAGNRDLLIGVKLRLGPGLTWDPQEALRLARQTADAADVPLMVHVTNSPLPLSQVLEQLRSGDILAHPFHAFTNGIMNPERTAVLEPIWEAQKRGVLFDSAHGRMGHFNFAIVRKALELGFMPDVITTDLSTPSATRGPVFDLVTTMSKFLNLGMSLQDVLLRTTVKPAELLGLSQDIGHLGVGAIADIAILDMQQGAFEFIDTDKNVLHGQQRIVAVSTLRAGRVCYRSGETVGATSTKPRAVFS
jgi:dihydroorotase